MKEIYLILTTSLKKKVKPNKHFPTAGDKQFSFNADF